MSLPSWHQDPSPEGGVAREAPSEVVATQSCQGSHTYGLNYQCHPQWGMLIWPQRQRVCKLSQGCGWVKGFMQLGVVGETRPGDFSVSR